MSRMVSRRRFYVKGALRRMLKKTNDKRLSIRIRIAIMAVDKRKPSSIASTVGCAVSTVNRVADRFREHSIEGLMDRREDNGDLKLDEAFLGQLREIVDQSPRDFGFQRPTWTRELLVAVMRKLTGICVHVGTMSRALRKIGARRGRVPQSAVPGREPLKHGESTRSTNCELTADGTKSLFTKMKSISI